VITRILRWRYALLATAALVLSACAGLAAFATLGQTAAAQKGSWTWSAGSIPGRPIAPDNTLDRMIAGSPGIDSSTLTEVASVGQGEFQNQLLAAKDASGTTCIAQRGGDFLCLDGRYDPYAVVVFPWVGGSALNVVDRATILGIARSDVARITLSLEDGTNIDLSPDKWRSFSYVSSGAASVPTELRAYDGAGQQLQTVGLTTAPLSSSPTKLP
jgi:hypothetical protein